MTKQTFGSALRQPWALIAFGAASYGKRPATTMAYLTDDEGEHYLGGAVEFYRKRAEFKLENGRYVERTPGDPKPCWHYRYQHPKRIRKADVLHIFPLVDKSKYGGPSPTMIRAARRALPVTMEEPESFQSLGDAAAKVIAKIEGDR